MVLIRAALVCLSLLVLAGCNDDGYGDDDPTSTPQASSSEEASEPTPSSENAQIREVDLEAQGDVQALLASTGGTLVAADVWYADLTGDDVEEATVPVSSGGTAGDVAVVVLTPADDGAEALFEYQPEAGGGLAVSVVAGQLVTTEPAPGPDDPECCPTQLRTIIHSWDGAAFTPVSDTLSPNPEGGNKTPISP